mgnify:CR=1 FL=1
MVNLYCLEADMKFILSIIAICLVLITGKLYIPEAQAQAPLDRYDVRRIVEGCFIEIKAPVTQEQSFYTNEVKLVVNVSTQPRC